MKKPIKAIGFCGLAGSGKDEAAKALGYLWTKIAFADQIKFIAQTQFKWNGQKDKAGRGLLQDIGMAGRKFNNDIWINFIRDALDRASWELSHIAITDVRFQNEADFIRNELGGKIIRIIRPGQVMEKFHNHVSENEQWKLDSDIVIENNGTIEELHAKVQEATR